MIEMTIDTKRFDRDVKKFAKKNNKDFRTAVRKGTTRMHFLAVNKAPVVTGNLRRMINLEILSKGLTGKVISRADYSEAVEKGTKPHTIRAKNKKVLAGKATKAPSGWDNISGDYAVYGKSVKHSGTEPQPFLYPAWKKATRKFYKLIGIAFK